MDKSSSWEGEACAALPMGCAKEACLRRVLFVIWSFSCGGGAERVLSHLITGLAKRGEYDLSLQEIVHFDRFWEYLPEGVHVLPPIVDEAPCKGLARAARGMKRRIIDLFPYSVSRFANDASKYDVVVAFNYQLPSFFLKKYSKTISWAHGSMENLATEPRKRRLQWKAYAHADRIVAITERTRRSILDLFPEFEQKTSVIYNGFDFGKIFDLSKEDPALSLQQLAFLFIGRLDENKNPLGVLESFQSIRTVRPDAKLYYLGEGELREQLEEAIERAELNRDVFLLGHVANPYPLMKQAECILSMSKAEGFQTVFVESLALGVPFVSSSAGAASLLSCEGRFGQVIECASEAGEAYRNLAAQKEKDASYGDDMLAFIKQFSLDAQVDAFDRLVNDLMEG